MTITLFTRHSNVKLRALTEIFTSRLFVTDSVQNPDAKRLYDDLLRKSGYNKLIRPVGNNTDKLTVKLGLRLSQLIDVVSNDDRG